MLQTGILKADDGVAKSDGSDVGLGFNLCVAPFLNICVPNLPQGQGWRMLEVVGVWSEVPY